MTVLAYRRAELRDLSFVVSSWASSFRESHAAGVIPSHLYTEVYRDRVLPWIIARPGVEIWVAYHPGETDPKMDLYGYVVVERGIEEKIRTKETQSGGSRVWVDRYQETDTPLLHWVYVKAAKRGHGIARGLLKAASVDPSEPFLFSFKPADWRDLSVKVPSAIWAPGIARREKRTK